MDDGVFDIIPPMPSQPPGRKETSSKPQLYHSAAGGQGRRPATAVNQRTYEDDSDDYAERARPPQHYTKEYDDEYDDDWAEQPQQSRPQIPKPRARPPAPTRFDEEGKLKGILRNKIAAMPKNSEDLLRIQEREFSRRAQDYRKQPFNLDPKLQGALGDFMDKKDYDEVEARAAQIMKENLEKKKG